ncbi:UDP-galactopyranose mutase [Niabella aquatica]
MFDYLIVGCGFAGSVLAERLASQLNKKVLIIDKRNHVGGNAFDYYNEQGILVHKYGPHIFHTNSKEIFLYLGQFTQWRPYEHHVLASVDGQLVPVPINLNTINALYNLNLDTSSVETYLKSRSEHVVSVATAEDVVVNSVGKDLYEKFFKTYTQKQWDMDPSELDSSVTARVPARYNRDNRYFTDTYQAMPLHGYTKMFNNMLSHKNIHIMLNTDYKDVKDSLPHKATIFTGPVDYFFDYCYGKLPYRSIDFSFETLETESFQPCATVNYPQTNLYTRITEFKKLTGQVHPKTTIVYEYPTDNGDPYYPIPRKENQALYNKYKALAQSFPNVYFTGRLGTYKYYNMDQVVAQSLTLFKKMASMQKIPFQEFTNGNHKLNGFNHKL